MESPRSCKTPNHQKTMKFKKQYIITIEGEASPAPVGCGSKQHEVAALIPHAAAIAMQVQEFYQTTLVPCRVRIEPVDAVAADK